MPIEKHYTTKQVAEILSLHPRTIQRQISKGDFGDVVYVSAKDIRIPESGIQMFLKNRTVKYSWLRESGRL